MSFFIVDGMALLFRSFHGMSRVGLTSPQGEPIGAVHGFLSTLLKVIKEFKPDYLAVCWESKTESFRKKMYSDYKAHRKETPEEIKIQIPIIMDIIKSLNIASFSVDGFEGDDLVGTLTHLFQKDSEMYILSGDKDFMQLINDKVFMCSLKKGDTFEKVGIENVKEYFGVSPSQVIDILALMGDSSDNVPGVKGIGEKKAASLIQTYGSLQGIYDSIEKIGNEKLKKQLIDGKEMALLSQKLVTIEQNVPLNISLRDCYFERNKILNEESISILLKYSLKTILKGFQEEMGYAFVKEFKDINNQEKPEKQEKKWERRNYVLVSSEEKMLELLNLIENSSCIAIDTETTGLDRINSLPIGVSFCFEEGVAYYVPIQTEEVLYDLFSSYEENFYFSKKTWERIQNSILKSSAVFVGHHLKFDAHMLKNVGIHLFSKKCVCTMVAAWLLQISEEGLSLDNLTWQLLNLRKIPTTDLIGKKSPYQCMKDVPIGKLSEYACEDVDATFRIWNILSIMLKEENLEKLYYEMEMPITKVLFEMERNGFYCDLKSLEELSIDIKKNMDSLTQDIYQECGLVFNINSSKQLGEVLFEKLKIHEKLGYKKKLKKTTLGYKTDISVLEEFEEHSFVKKIIEYRELSKMYSTYVESLPREIQKSTGRIHTDFLQTGTQTGRLASARPNLQNIPIRSLLGQKVRRCFAVSCKDHLLYVADYSQIELRILAHMAEESSMIDAFLNQVDIHAQTASKLHHVSLEEVTKEQRNSAKSINFGILYGMGPQRLAKSENITVLEAKAFIERYFLNFPRLKDYIASCYLKAEKEKRTSSLFGRIRSLKELEYAKGLQRNHLLNMSVNTPIQGTAADIMKYGMILVWEKLQEKKLKTKLLLQVHDEIILEGPSSEKEEVLSLIKESMENVCSLKVPLIANVSYGENWLDAKKD